jgi:hypothetical protein
MSMFGKNMGAIFGTKVEKIVANAGKVPVDLRH